MDFRGPAQEVAGLQQKAKDIARERDRYREALREIINPLKYIENRAADKGLTVDYTMALKVIDDPRYLQEIAERALTDD
jgi:hypothetical protein